jgi:exportin-1
LRDFLISLREFSGTDNADLYLAEKEQAQKDAEKAELDRRSKVSGLLKPSELQDEDEL